MKKINLLFLFFYQCIAFQALGQSITDADSPVKKGPEGVYFFAAFQAEKSKGIADMYKNFEQLQGQFSYDNKTFKTITILTRPKTYTELAQRLGEASMAELKNYYATQNEDEIFKKIMNFNLGSIFLLMDKSFSKLIGFTGYAAFSKAKPVAYRLIGINSNGQSETIYTVKDNGVLPPLPKANLSHHMINDSVVNLTWYIPAENNERALYASIYKKSGNTYQKLPLIILGNKIKDSIKYNFSENVSSDNFYQYYISIEDYGGFTGPSSDTANMLAVSARQIKSIKNFMLKDSLGDVYVSWNGIPNKGYFSGIEISKSRAALDKFVVLDTLPITDTSFVDQNIIPGTLYYYSIKALAYPFTYIEGLPSATANINIENKSSKPFAPTAVVAVNEEKNIRLSWEDNPELDLYAYFVYRGTNANNMEQVSGIVQGNNWLDTSVTLSGLTTYAYAVKVMNRGQRMSEASAPVYIKPLRLSEVPAIGGITGIPKDDGYLLQWENIAANYTSIIGYVLLRKASNEKEFFPVAQSIIEGASYTDSTSLQPNTKYEYAVAAIDYNGSIGQLSPSVFYTANNNKLKSPADFSAFIDNGKIKIKWPEEANGLLNKKVNIYRKSSAEKDFKLIGTSAGNEFTDEKTVSKILYTYSLSVSLNNMESEKSTTQSVRAK